MGIKQDNAILVTGGADAIRITNESGVIGLEQNGEEIVVLDDMIDDLISVLEGMR